LLAHRATGYARLTLEPLDEKAKDAMRKAATATDEVAEVVCHIPAAILRPWGMTDVEVRLVLPGEPIGG
jgi:hypothetical protein